jgi:phospholipid/cholesterol/gamma-HCH transport system permease protein
MAGAAKAPLAVSIEGGVLRVSPEGPLTSETVGSMRRALENALPARLTTPVTLDLSRVEALDASGVSVAVFLFRLASAAGVGFTLDGADKDRKLLVDLALRGQEPQSPPAPIGVVRGLGVAGIDIWRGLVDLVRFIGEIVLVLAAIARRPHLLRVHDTISAMARHGSDAILVVGLLGFLIGAIIAFQTFDPMARYGASLQVADVVAVSVVRELGPLITAIILAGRSGSAFAAEIGTMKVTQELDALRTFGIDPVRFLVIPRLIATTVVTPMLAIWASILGVAGGYMILAPEGFTLAQYTDEVRQALTVGGFVQGLVKAAVFAILVASIGCLSGLRTGQGPGAVGLSTTRAVVAGIVAIILADSVLGAFFYTLGI